MLYCWKIFGFRASLSWHVFRQQRAETDTQPPSVPVEGLPRPFGLAGCAPSSTLCHLGLELMSRELDSFRMSAIIVLMAIQLLINLEYVDMES